MEQTPTPPDVEAIVHEAVAEYLRSQDGQPDYKMELNEERRRRRELEQRVNALVEDNRQARQQAEATEQWLP